MAPSKESAYLKELFDTFSANFPQDDNLFLERAIYDQVQKAATEPLGVHYESVTIANQPAIWVRPEGASLQHAMLFMHGGGFSFGSPSSHRKLTAHLAKACNIPALSIDYRLAPEHPFPAAIDDCVAAYKHLLSLGIDASRIVVAGDSCGGCLSTAVPLACKQQSLPQPACAVSLSPSYDARPEAFSGGSMDSNEGVDSINSKTFCDKLSERYTAGDVKLRSDPLITPLLGDLKGVCPHWLSLAGHDMLFDSGMKMKELLKEAGVEVVCEVGEGMQHVFEFMAGRAPEADKSIERIGEWVRMKIRLFSAWED